MSASSLRRDPETWCQVKNSSGSFRTTQTARQNRPEPNSERDSLDAVCQNDEADDDTDDAIQKPNIRMILEDFCTDEDGKSHDAAH